jgi:hypothetical protein
VITLVPPNVDDFTPQETLKVLISDLYMHCYIYILEIIMTVTSYIWKGALRLLYIIYKEEKKVTDRNSLASI